MRTLFCSKWMGVWAFAVAAAMLPGLGTPDAFADDAMAPILSLKKFQLPSGLTPLRRAVVKAGLSQVGKLSSAPAKTRGLGGKRFGWERLEEYVKSAFGWSKVPDDWLRKIRAIQVPDGKMHPANNWCGYFATWALQRAGVAGLKWQFGTGLKKALGKPRTDLKNMRPGDVALFSLRSHYALVASIDGEQVVTIDGNASFGEVNLHKRKLGSAKQRIVAFHSLDDLPAAAVKKAKTGATFGAAAGDEAVPPSSAAAKGSYENLRLEPTPPIAPQGLRQALKLTYIMADDPGIGRPSSDLLETLLTTPFSNNAHSVIFADLSVGGSIHKPNAALYAPSGASAEKPLGSRLSPGLEVVQSNNPALLEKVVSWAVRSFPATNRYLQLVGHGTGIFGMGTDGHQVAFGEPATDRLMWGDAGFIPSLPIATLTEAVRRGAGGQPFEVLFLTSCLMANVEAMYEMEPIARFIVASQTPIWGVPHAMRSLTIAFEKLIRLGKPGSEVARLVAAQAIPARVKREAEVEPSVLARLPANTESGYRSVVAVDTAKLKPLVASLDGLARALLAALPTHGAAIVAAYDAPPAYAPGVASSMRDLWMFTSELLQRVKEPQVVAQVRAVRAAQTAAMLFEKDHLGAAKGLTIVMPGVGRTGTPPPRSRFLRETSWGEFIAAIGKLPRPPKKTAESAPKSR